MLAVGAVLSHNGHPLAFFIKKLGVRMAAASTYARELYAITESVKKWRHYLLGRLFRIFTDHQSIKDLISQSVQTPDQHKWLSKLLGFTYEIFTNPLRRMLLLTPYPTFRLLPLVSNYPSVSRLLPSFNTCSIIFSTNPDGRQLLLDSASSLDYSVRNGLLYFRQKLLIRPASAVVPLLLSEFHSSPLGGHSGSKATLARVAASFYWPSMAKDVKAFVKTCTICQQNKYST
ncbi:UNVERIFIED_CONTAM: Retrovirus-related Pol polyprotein from transposon.6 [Sesamum radiatum]|uniref:Retrovirus-related Pol polyprotein from transposon.6 n=1 Tax=Sesamum radiatum TaxID=300843 RepID=A0AAW2Q0Y5_SESRA